MNEPEQPTTTWTCHCGEPMARYRGQGDQSCQSCGQWYNAGGQALRNDWMNNPSTWDDDTDDLEGFEVSQTRYEEY